MKLKPLFEKRAALLEPEGEREAGRYLVVSDLHIGFEEKFQGARLKPNVEGMINELEIMIDDTSATDLVIAGDVKSGTDRILQSEWENVPRFLSRLSKKCKVSIVPGNHDGGLVNLAPDFVKLEDMNGLLIYDTLVLHGHTRPLLKYKDARRLVMGHVHPIFQRRGNPLSGQPVWAFLKLPKKAIFSEILPEDKEQIEVVLLPSFNLELASSGYASESSRAERRVSPIVRQLREAGDAVVVTLSGEVIGDSNILSSVL